ncbi:hypothetical protein RRF57_009005 [Xylaria bambusicola]|uniref:Oxidoreductase-like domain-containing protein n=1 Tax=Xylaria bambusicola TaxID=326684 RepID=A0AAN7ZBN3_9PEZI
MPPSMRPLVRVARAQSALSRNPYTRAFASKGANPLPGGTPGESSIQAMPIGPYYESILTDPQPIPKAKPEQPPASSPKSPRAKKAAAEPKSKASGESSSSTGTATSTTSASAANATTVPPQPSAEPATAQDKARIIFGSRLAGPAERADRLQSIRDRSTLIAGVLVPPRPEEPDNCCMSGCVNCVWDRYGEELEEWAAASARAEQAAAAQSQAARRSKLRQTIEGDRKDESPASAMSMDDDGGGSESNWRQPAEQEEEEIKAKKSESPKIAKDLWDDELYRNVPVGIREFMKQERRLKKKHQEEGKFGA